MTSKTLLGILAILLLTITVVHADPRNAPNQFYGDVTVNGEPIKDNVLINVRNTDGDFYAAASTENGAYGYDPIFYVTDGPQEGQSRDGETLTFYLVDNNDQEIQAGTATFVIGGSTRLDLEVGTGDFSVQSSGDDGASGSSGGSSGGGGGGGSFGATTTDNNEEETNDTTEASNTGSNEDTTTSTQEANTQESTCTPNWECSEWFDCVGGTERRVCVDQNSCGTDEGKPEQRRNCQVTNVEDAESTGDESQGFTSTITGAVTGGGIASIIGIAVIALVVAGLIFFLARRRNEE